VEQVHFLLLFSPSVVLRLHLVHEEKNHR
jgi:hypothetical protein